MNDDIITAIILKKQSIQERKLSVAAYIESGEIKHFFLNATAKNQYGAVLDSFNVVRLEIRKQRIVSFQLVEAYRLLAFEQLIARYLVMEMIQVLHPEPVYFQVLHQFLMHRWDRKILFEILMHLIFASGFRLFLQSCLQCHSDTVRGLSFQGGFVCARHLHPHKDTVLSREQLASVYYWGRRSIEGELISDSLIEFLVLYLSYHLEYRFKYLSSFLEAVRRKEYV